ncbi:telomere-associated protein RIF1 isoform X2 [Rhinatrema bivittatum]|nr:telomere-associated protein RIF1 isoform X2 [Rhinatrema bivittatum]XP_029461322.1 telomere-associated protein RIF1 isoform X2 [Rhinatrema bivittatum]
MTAVCAEDSPLLPLLETLEDSSVSRTEQTDAYLAIANRLSGEEGQIFTGLIGKQFTRLCKVFKVHISIQDSELNNAALQALGFCVFNAQIASELSATEIQELLSSLNSIAIETSDKNTCTRALWVISKQSFPPEEVGKAVPCILSTLETVLNKDDVQSMVVEHEALNVVIRLLEQTPAQMEVEAVRWAKLIIPLVVHGAYKVRLKGATALEMGMPLLLQKQQEIAVITEQLMTTKIISELQRLFSTKNETFVLKLWPLFVKLLGKTLHRSGSFINSLLQLEELGFRSSSPPVKKIAFIAWKGLIDNFALNPDILCSTKRLKLLMQPLSSIHVRSESLALTKLEVWWYLLMRLGPQLPVNFEQVCAPLIQNTLNTDSSAAPQGTPRGAANQTLNSTAIQKAGSFPFSTPATPRMNLNSSVVGTPVIPSIQLLGIEMLLHFLLGPEVLTFAKENKLVLSLEPLQHPLINSASFFCKHASTILNAIQEGFIAVGKDASDAMLNVIWKDVIAFVKAAVEAGNKRERQGSEVLTLLLKTLKNIVVSNALPVQKTLTLLEATIKGLPQKVLGSPAYQVANMDLLNGTPALFLVQLFFHDTLLEYCVKEERFFVNLETLVSYVLSGPTSPLTFSESVLGILNQSATLLENKEHLWRMWSIVVTPLTEWINQTNEVNQGDALEHNFNAVHSALTLPIIHIFQLQGFPQPTMKSLLRTWSELYRAFARCADLVSTTEENVCCEELCAKILHGIEDEALISLSLLDGIAQCVTVVVECINFSPYNNKFQPKIKAPQTPTDWSKKKQEPLGNLTSLVKLLVKMINSFHALNSKETQPETPTTALVCVGSSIICILSSFVSHISLTSAIRKLFAVLIPPLTIFYEKKSKSQAVKVYNSLSSKLEKLLGDLLHCLQSCYTGTYDSELLDDLSSLLCVIFPHKSKQIRNQTIQFWNATFAKAAVLRYHEELRPILSKMKQKVPLLLPGFESVDIMEESSGPYSDPTENSQLNPKISGIEVKSTGKRDSLLFRTEDSKENTTTHGTHVKLKLDFSSSNTKSSVKLLEEEKSVDFVFIPPETKQRLLTEHQKEVLRTKRVDIPTMYNDLDASQDVTLFNQYTQSQEDSLEKTNVTETKKEDCEKMSKDEKVDIEVSSSIQELATEPTKRVPLVKNEDESQKEGAKGFSTKQVQESFNESACKESSVCDVSVGENTSNVSSTSGSSDIVSGTPPHPASRRQSFITLEKFDSSGSRPFSPSSLNTFSTSLETVLKSNSEEAMNSAEMLIKEVEELGEKNISTSVPEPKKAVGIKRSARRSINSEHTDNQMKLPERHDKNEQEGLNISVPTENISAADRDLQLEGRECISDTQSPVIDSSMLEPTIGDKQVIDSDIERLNCSKPDVESKENTPPEVVPDQISIDDTQSLQTASNQKLPRRSSRRRSDISGNVTDSQDKEENCQLKKEVDRDETISQKKVSHTKDESLLRQKNADEREKNNNDSHEKTQEESGNKRESLSEDELNKSAKTFEADGLKLHTNVLQDSRLDKGSQKKSRERPRYQTRRSAQVLLPSVVKSETDSLQKNITKRKRIGKVTAKSRVTLEKDRRGKEKSENKNIALLLPETVTNSDTFTNMKIESESSSDMEDTVSSQMCEVQDEKESCEVISKLTGLDSKCSTGTSNTSLDLGQTHDVREDPSTKSFISEPSVEVTERNETDVNRDVKEICSNLGSFLTEPTVGDFSTAVSDAFPHSENSHLDCQHKRSKRVRRSKSCDCCGERLHLHEKSFAEVKNAESKDEKMEQEKMPLQASKAMTETTSGDTQFDDCVFTDVCAVSTPLLSMNRPSIFKASVREVKSDLESEQENAVVPEGERNNEIREEMQNVLLNEKSGPAIEIAQSMEQSVETPVPPSDFSSKEAIEHDPTSETENKQPLSLGLNKEVNENKPVEEVADAEMIVGNIENRTIDEPNTDSVQNMKERSEKQSVETNCDTHCETKDILIDPEGASDSTRAENVTTAEQILEMDRDVGSPQKLKGLDAVALVTVNESPSGMQARCVWSPLASPCTSILKKGVKRTQENDSPSPVNKMRRVSFADPIYKEELADNIDRRSPIVRSNAVSNGSPSARTLKISPNMQGKHITTPTKGFLSPGSRSPGFKSSKKCLITEMTKESRLSPKESIYPALVNCTAPVDIILPQITSNMWARGLGQLIRAKNIKTVGDLSTLTAAEIKTLPIRSPKISTVKKALRVYHEQQIKSRGLEEFLVLEDVDKPVNGLDDKHFTPEEEKLETGPAASASDTKPSTGILTKINTIATQITAEDLSIYSGDQLFEMQERLSGMSNCIIRHLQSRWKSGSTENSA